MGLTTHEANDLYRQAKRAQQRAAQEGCPRTAGVLAAIAEMLQGFAGGVTTPPRRPDARAMPLPPGIFDLPVDQASGIASRVSS